MWTHTHVGTFPSRRGAWSRRLLLLQNQYAAVKRSHRRALVLRYLALGRLDAAVASEAGAPVPPGAGLPPSPEALHAA